MPKNGAQELTSGDKHSLLGIAWEVLRKDFDKAFADLRSQPKAQPQQAEFDFPPAGKTIPLRRLPVDWKPEQAAPVPATKEEAPEPIELPRGSLPARAFGIVVHALLEDLAAEEGLADVSAWRAKAVAMLRANGLPRAEAEPKSAEVVRALQSVLKDPTGRWIMGARAGARTEIAWSSWADDEVVRSLRSDRIFRAGATPCSTEDTHLWIVDYKTATHGLSGLDAFLAAEKEKYRQQLEAYAAVTRKVEGETRPIRLALYYPLLSRLVWW
jgi:ATP-dependent exoDNAse (exonuclease V) beta subunit